MSYPSIDPPFYFRRVWSGATEMDEVTVMTRGPDGSMQILLGVPHADLPSEVREQAVEAQPLVDDGLVIYGRAVIPEEDRDYVLRMAKRGQVFAQCFSVRCPEGELGTHPRAAITEISRDEFEAAKERDWQ